MVAKLPKNVRYVFVLLIAACVLPGLALAQSAEPPVPQEYDWHEDDPLPTQTDWGTPIDQASSEQIRSWTTRAEFMNPLLDYLPADDAVVSPTDHFGYPIGRPDYLHDVDEINGYYEALAQSSDQVNFLTLGQSEEGRDFKLLQIGTPENLARLEEVKQGMNALADPRQTSENEAREWIDDLPVIYTIYTGLHSPETAHPEMAMEAAYRLALAEHPMIQETLENVVVFLVPIVEPDGRDRFVEWYRRHGEDVYSDEDTPPSAPYWGSYAGHDNNRNALQLYLRLSEEMLDLFLEWKHPISMDVHEAGSVVYHYFSTGTGPYNTYIDPIIIKEWQWMANYESTALEHYGMPGVYTHDFYDGWFPGYLFWITNNRNAIGRFTETWGGMGSIPYTRVREATGRQIERDWFRPNPPSAETNWSFRNMINFQQSGVLHTLNWASRNREQVLQQFWTKSKNSLERGQNEAPYAWVVPADQERKADTGTMLNLIRKHGIEVHQSAASGSFGEYSVSEGDYVIRMDQPYRDFAQMLMDEQEYPADGEQVAYIRGGMAWTFPLMFNVEAYPIDDPGVQDLDMRLAEEEIALEGTVQGEEADFYAAHPMGSALSIQARFALDDASVRVARESINVGDADLPAGSWLIDGGDVAGSDLDDWARTYGYEVYTLSAADVENVSAQNLSVPRIGLLHTWRETRDEGPVRFALDDMEIPYTMISETALGDRNLHDEFDVIIFPEQGRNTTGKQIFEGVDDSHAPIAYTQTDEFPSHGYPNSAEDITGGMGYDGLRALQSFLDDGGTFVTMGSASRLPIDYSLTRRVSAAEPNELIVPGSIVRGMVADADNPLTFGYGEEIPLWHKFGPYLSVPDRDEDHIALRYAEEDDLFMSGVVVGGHQLAQEPALVSKPVGEGHLVLFGFNPMHRYQPHGNFSLVWNSILYWDQLD